jgi:hypothetical protein
MDGSASGFEWVERAAAAPVDNAIEPLDAANGCVTLHWQEKKETERKPS